MAGVVRFETLYFRIVRIATNTVEDVLVQYREDLAALYPQSEVRAITCAVFHDRLGWDAVDLMLNRQAALSESELLGVYLPLKRLRTGEPLQYVLGHVDFHGLRIKVDPSVLIPRPETEELVDLIIRSRTTTPQRIIDIGTGSGCIALAIKKAFPQAEVFGLDISQRALETARHNGMLNRLEVRWAVADVLDERCMLPARSDLIVSNPPYIPRADASTLHHHVRDHEPHEALFVDGEDPLRFYRAIADHALTALVAGGELWFEGHHIHTPAVGTLLEATGFSSVRVLNDLSGAPRFIHAVR